MLISSISEHAALRMKQRSISQDVVDAIYVHGECRRRHGADVYFVDREARDTLRQELGPKRFARLERAFKAYLVVGDNERLVTCAHAKRRLRWH